MAQQGLFTQGPSIDELLSKRNQRGADLQQQLMQQASQGAARPMETQAASLIGSSLGRALAGSLSGGKDKKREALEARNAQQSSLRQEALAVSRGTIAEKRAFITKIAPIYPEYAQELNDRVNAQQAAEAEKIAAEKERTTALELAAEHYKKAQERLDAKKPPLSNDGKLLVESGMVAGSPEFEAKMREIVDKKGTLKTLQTPLQQVQMFSEYVQQDPQYKLAKARLVKVDDGFDALALLRNGNEKSRPLLERTVSEVYNSDTRAASEIDRLVSSGSVGRRMRDWITGGFQGKPSEATVSDYEQLLSTVDTAMRDTVNGVVGMNEGLYKTSMGAEHLSAAVNTLRMTPRAPQVTNEVNLGQSLGSTDRPDGTFTQKGKSFIIKNGNVYASE